jgi:hypothetical protein
MPSQSNGAITDPSPSKSEAQKLSLGFKGRNGV